MTIGEKILYWIIFGVLLVCLWIAYPRNMRADDLANEQAKAQEEKAWVWRP